MSLVTFISFALYSYCRPLAKGKKRRGIILELKTKQGEIGFGEIAPLPGFSKESLFDAEKELKKKVLPLFTQKPFSFHRLQTLLPNFFPSVQFGLESALLDIISPSLPAPVPVNALIQGSQEEMAKSLEKSSHYPAIKIKLSSHSVLDAKNIFSMLFSSSSKQKIRIDINKKWNLEEALSFAHLHTSFPIEYYEEPLANSSDISHFPYPFAWDETAREKDLSSLLRYPNCKALIIKPTLSGGWSALSPLASFCRKKEIDFILSSSYESEIGIMQIAKLGKRWKLLTNPMGLDTFRYFTMPLISERLYLCKGKLQFPQKWSLRKESINGCFRVPL